MVWSKLNGATLLAGLAFASFTCVGLVYSQQTGSRPAATTADSTNIVTVNEPGKPPQKAVVLKTYRTADGKSAMDVKILATGEVSTLYTGPVETSASKTPTTEPNRLLPPSSQPTTVGP